MNWMDFMMRILLAVLLGFLIGLERQITGHTAGIRINVLISMGSCLFLMFPIITGSDEVYRIASYIVSGVGFLCSGVIFQGRRDSAGAQYSRHTLVHGGNRRAGKLRILSVGICRNRDADSFKPAVPPPVHESQAGYRLGGERKTLPYLDHLPGSQGNRYPCSPH